MEELLNQIREGPPKGSPFSVALSNSQVPGRSSIYRNWKFQDALLTTLDKNITTMHEMFERSASVYRTQNCLGYRPYNAESSSYGPYSWISYSAAAERRKNFGAGLMKTHQDICGSLPQGGVGLWCNNRPEWQIVDLGCMSQSLFTVSIYETLGVQATEYIINQVALTVVCASAGHVEKLQSLAPRCPSLKFLVIMDDVTSEANAEPY
ncbi:acetyl-CoA synthetase-like protein, partial [Aureobasidium melanogenum]